MQKSSSPGNSFDEAAAGGGTPDAAPVVGDADAVQKTTWVVGKGTDPDASLPLDGATPGRTPSGAPPQPATRRGTDGLDR